METPNQPAPGQPVAAAPPATPAAPSGTAGTGPVAAPDFAAHETWSAWIKWLAPLVLALTLALVVQLVNKTPAAAAVATVTFITGAAVGVERVIEGFWNLLGSRIGVYWPMTSISKQVYALENELAESMAPFHTTLVASLQQVQAIEQKTPGVLAQAQADMQRMKNRFDDIRAHAPSNQRMQLLAASASQSVNFLLTKYQQHLPQLTSGVALADTAVNGMQTFLATFKDNPGRRLLSLYLGALLGVLLAALFQLDVFAAVGITQNIGGAGLRVAFTGLLIGLGSNPTHEIIQVLQEYKKGQKGDNTAKPELPSRLMQPQRQ